MDEQLNLDVRGARPGFFEQPETDALMTALLEVMSQLWIQRDYTLALEKALVERGILPADAVANTAWSPQQQAEHSAAQQRFLRDALRAVGAPMQSLNGREAAIDAFQGGAQHD